MNLKNEKEKEKKMNLKTNNVQVYLTTISIKIKNIIQIQVKYEYLAFLDTRVYLKKLNIFVGIICNRYRQNSLKGTCR